MRKLGDRVAPGRGTPTPAGVRPPRRSPGRALRRLAAALLAAAALGAPPPARAAWQPEGVDLARPRLLLRADDPETVRARLPREPYRTLFLRLLDRAAEADAVALDDDSLGAHRIKARAAKNLAFVYAVGRTAVGGEIVPFPDAAAREAVGDRARDLLLHLYPRSRLAVPPPLGDWDRDISTSEELLQYAVAFDTLLGAGYDPGADGEVIAERLTDLASELYLNYLVPSTADESTFTEPALLHWNNHRSKTGAALVAAGVALAERTPAPGTDPLGIREPSDWIDYGLDQIDLVMRQVLVAGDGAYGEGTHYLGFASQNLHPVLRAWDRLLGGASWPARGLVLPSLWRHPLYLRTHRWALDMTLPDGSLVPLDDAFVGRAFPFGTAPAASPALARAFAWRWANAPVPWESSGNVDLSADAIVHFDDGVDPAPPPGSPSAFYLEGGTAVLRSDWGRDAVMAVVLGEYDTASEFGFDRDGRGVSPQSHEHEDPASLLLHAFGERLLLDPGMVDFSLGNPLARPDAHSTILVDGLGPLPYLLAHFQWQQDPDRRPPADGHAILHDPVDGDFLDAVSVVTRYGQPADRAATIRRRVLFPDHRYLLVADALRAPDPRRFTWLLHGHGGGSSGGSFGLTATGGRWSRPAARLDAALAVADAVPRLGSALAGHEAPGRVARTHEVLRAETTGTAPDALTLLYPTRAAEAPPRVHRPALPGLAALVLEDLPGDRRVAAAWRAAAGTPLVLPPAETGLPEAASDGGLLLVDARADGTLRLAWSEAATRMVWDGAPLLEVATPGTLGVRPGRETADFVVANADAVVELPALPFVPAAADGACALRRRGERGFVTLGRERRFTVRAAAGNARPAADPGPDRRVAVGGLVPLDGRASCDADGDDLRPRWELVSAPPGSLWELRDAETFAPRLLADRPGPYRVELVVTDARGAASRPVEVTVVAGDPCADGRDDDLDALLDGDDPDCDTPADANRPPVAADDAWEVPAGAPFASPDSVLANDADPDGDALTAAVVEPPAHGSLLLRAGGGFFYEPGPDFAGEDAFLYEARDADGAASAPARVALRVVPSDEATLLLRGGLRFFQAGPLASGDVALERDARGRLRRVRAEGTLAPADAPGVTRFALDFRRLFGALHVGSFRLEDPALPDGAVARAAAVARIRRAPGGGATGHVVVLRPRPPFLFAFALRDRDASNAER